MTNTIDCVMLAWGKTEASKKMTQDAIDSLHSSSTEYKFNVIVVETCYETVGYRNATEINPRTPFNYNAYLNVGFKHCSSEYIIVANNDLVFHPGWFEEVVKANFDSTSCYTDNYTPHLKIRGSIVPGYRVGYDVCGWCIVMKRKVLDKIGTFDEQFNFWYADNDYAMQLKKNGFSHALVGTAWVTHLYSQSHKLLTKEELKSMTTESQTLFDHKYANPTICLTSIVKDEAHIITEMLESVVKHINYWVIVDTGSTDGTQQIIKDFFAKHNVPGELHERPWREFGPSRTEAFELADGKADYMLVMDADDKLVGNVSFKGLTLDSYNVHAKLDDTHYLRHQLFHSGLKWKYLGVRHEYAHSDLAKTNADLTTDFYIEARCAGARSKDPKRFEKDALALEESIKKNPNEPRDWFYLGQSYFDCGNYIQSKRAYRHRLTMDGSVEEKYFAQWRIGLCSMNIGEPDETVIMHMLRANEMSPNRAEPFYNLSAYFRSKKRYAIAYAFAKLAAGMPYPKSERLFVLGVVYDFRALDELAVCGTYLGKEVESLEVFKKLLAKPLPMVDRIRIEENVKGIEKALGL